jgi:anthranilate phosphoribosyltransferase
LVRTRHRRIQDEPALATATRLSDWSRSQAPLNQIKRFLGFAFFFAPKYHPAFQHIAPARQICAQLGQHTIFNFPGPLLNPARPTAQLIGVPRPELCEPIARVLQSLGVRRGMVVCGQVEPKAKPLLHQSQRGFLDELSPLDENEVTEFYQDRGFARSTLSPDNFSLQTAAPADLAGADRETNAVIVHQLLRGDERGPKRDAVLLTRPRLSLWPGE